MRLAIMRAAIDQASDITFAGQAKKLMPVRIRNMLRYLLKACEALSAIHCCE